MIHTNIPLTINLRDYIKELLFLENKTSINLPALAAINDREYLTRPGGADPFKMTIKISVVL